MLKIFNIYNLISFKNDEKKFKTKSCVLEFGIGGGGAKVARFEISTKNNI
jgi:hypothetical protein